MTAHAEIELVAAAMSDESIDALKQLPGMVAAHFFALDQEDLPEELTQALTISFQEQMMEDILQTAYWEYPLNDERNTDTHAAAVLEVRKNA